MNSKYINPFDPEEFTVDLKDSSEINWIRKIPKEEIRIIKTFSKRTKSAQTIQLEFSKVSGESTTGKSNIFMENSKLNQENNKSLQIKTSYKNSNREKLALFKEINDKIKIRDFLRETFKKDSVEKMKIEISELINSITENLDRNFHMSDLNENLIDKNEKEGIEILKLIQESLRMKSEFDAEFGVHLTESKNHLIEGEDKLVNYVDLFTKSYKTTLAKFGELENKLVYRNLLVDEFYKKTIKTEGEISLNYSYNTNLTNAQSVRTLNQKVYSQKSEFLLSQTHQILSSQFVEKNDFSKTDLISKDFITNNSNKLMEFDKTNSVFEVDFLDPDHIFLDRKSMIERLSITKLSRKGNQKSIINKSQRNQLTFTEFPDLVKDPAVIKFKNYYDDLIEDLQSQLCEWEKVSEETEDILVREINRLEVFVISLTDELKRVKKENAEIKMDRGVQKMELHKG